MGVGGLRGSAPGPVLTGLQSAHQALDALQLVGSVLLRAGLRGRGRYPRGVAGHLRGGVQGDRGAGRNQPVRFQLGPTTASCAGRHGGHGGGEQRAVRHRHGEGVRAVPEAGAHRVQKRVPVHRGRGSGRGGGRCCHVGVGIREQTAER